MKTNPYLILDGTAEAAFTLYAKVLRGKIVALSRFGDVPEACEGIPESAYDKVMHVCLQLGDDFLMASDSHPAYPYEGIKGSAVSINLKDAAEVDRLFGELSKDGSVQMPPGETHWAQRFAMCTDRFGVAWMFNCDRQAA